MNSLTVDTKGRQQMNLFKWLTHANSVHDVVLSLYKRGLASAMKHDQKGARDAYTAAIDMPDAPADLRAMALYNRALLSAAANEFPQAVQDLNAVLAMQAAPQIVKSAAIHKLDRMRRRDDTDTAPRLHTRASSREATSMISPLQAHDLCSVV
jgi:hypothetical protein